ncbi:DUF805 domain-containing protein [Jannaschia marina]|uniref:DUF805 domain-containing protein n=1 Tax=Jannaschia marina TaxID=2741674 RepID=UPI0015CEF443|nr:DUF805 domain-containing protein [Jannaschia marina]
MSPVAATVTCLKRPFRFRGRASRSEFWWFTLTYFALGTLASIWAMMPFVETMVAAQTNALAGGEPMSEPELLRLMGGFTARAWIVTLLLVWPMVSQIAVTIRRLHDIDRSGWWWWIQLVPFVGYIILLILLVMRGDDGDNRFGPPKGGARRKRASPQAVRYTLPGEAPNPLDAVSGAEALRALRQERMEKNAMG